MLVSTDRVKISTSFDLFHIYFMYPYAFQKLWAWGAVMKKDKVTVSVEW